MSIGLKSVAAAVLIPAFGLVFGAAYWLRHSGPAEPPSRPVPVRPPPAMTIPLARPDTLGSTTSSIAPPAGADTLAGAPTGPATATGFPK